MADPTKIHQIVMNLCTNAYHSMIDTGGVLVVTLQEIEISDQGSIPKLDIPEGSYVKLEVNDTLELRAGGVSETKTIKAIDDSGNDELF